MKSELKFVKRGLDVLTLLMDKHHLTTFDNKFNYIKYTLYLVFKEEVKF
jgi:hypothetical protein